MPDAQHKPFWMQLAADAEARTPSRNLSSVVPEGPLAEVLRAVPPSVHLELSDHQIAVLNEALARRRRSKTHTVDYRGGISWFGRRYYFSFFFGREAREFSKGKPKHSARRIVIKAGAMAGLYILCAVAAFTVIAALYLIKSILGIDLFDGPSPLHALFF